MINYELIKLMYEALECAEEASKNSIFIMKPTTYAKLEAIDRIASAYQGTYETGFDAATNAFDIRLENYVFDSVTDDLKELFSITDLFVIDALSDGKVCIEMRVLNACTEIKEGLDTK